MVSISGAKQVINLFVHNQGERLITKPKTVQMFAEDLSKLRYAPQLEGDVMTLSPQAKKAAERIADLKSRILEVNGEKYTYEQFRIPSLSEDMNLTYWFSLLKNCAPIPKNQQRCLDEINKCFESENLKKIGFFKNLSEHEIELLNKSYGIDIIELMAVLSGHKPAYFDTSKGGVIDFAKAIKGTKYADEFLAINVKSSPKKFCILNKKQVQEIVENNKEIYCRELGLDINTPTEKVYKKWLKCIENEYPSGEKPFTFGLTLGYPKNSSIIYMLQSENGIICTDKELLKVFNQIKGANDERYRALLLKAFYNKDSPFKNYSEEFKREFEHYVRTEDFRSFMNPFEERFVSSFKLYGSDSVDMKRIVKNEVDFVNNFRMEQLF